MIEASTTPQKLPSPPMTTITKAAVMTSLPIAGWTPRMGARHDASKRREPDADRDHGRHHGRQRDAERAHHVRVLHARAHDPAERGLVEEEPQARRRPATVDDQDERGGSRDR